MEELFSCCGLEDNFINNTSLEIFANGFLLDTLFAFAHNQADSAGASLPVNRKKSGERGQDEQRCVAV